MVEGSGVAMVGSTGVKVDFFLLDLWGMLQFLSQMVVEGLSVVEKTGVVVEPMVGMEGMVLE